MPALCRATLNYARRDPSQGKGLQAVEVEILDARRAGLPGWKECGFELVDHSPSIADWADDRAIAAGHYAEVEELARKLTGADHALLSDHVKRTPEQAKRDREQRPVHLVHSDYAANYADVVRQAYRDVGGRGAATLERNGITAEDVEQMRRIVVMQFWRNLGPPKMDYPLAFCDSRTVTPDQTRPFPYTGYSAGGLRFDALSILAPDDAPSHAWYCFPEMHVGEVVAFRTFDTDLVERNVTWFTPHSAFHDPEVQPGMPARLSIELRVICLFR